MARHPHHKDSDRSVAKGVERLSRLLTRERDRMHPDYLRDADLRHAYRTYYLPVNRAKVHLPLYELSLHPAGLLDRDRLRILDAGSGPGTALLGALAFFLGRTPAAALAFTAVDHIAENLRIAETIFREVRDENKADAVLRTVACRIEELPEHITGAFDLILLSNALNELFARADDRVRSRVGLLDRMLRSLLADGGSCVIIEPALRETSRDLLLVRDGLLDAGWRVYSPCLMQEHCPALQNPRDWCHEDRTWEAPETVREIDARTGLRKDSLKFSYVILRKDQATLADAAGGDAFRVVSEPLVSKGKTDIYLCGGPGRRMATRLDKDSSPSNASFAMLKRGDVVSFRGLEDGEKRWRVTKATEVSVRRWQEAHEPDPS